MKKFLFFTLIALLAMLPFSCSNDGFKEPESKQVATEKVTCVVDINIGGKMCYEVSASACEIMGGTQGSIKDCKNPFLEGTESLADSIVGDSLYIKGVVKITEEGLAEKEKIDSIVITVNGNFDVEYEPVPAEGISEYNFAEKVKPIDLSIDEIECDTTYRISITIYAGDETPETKFITFKKPKHFCKDEYSFNFTCKWTPETQDYGKTTTPSLSLGSGVNSEDCEWKMYTVNSESDTILFTLDSTYTILENIFDIKEGLFVAKGYVVCEDSTRKGSLTQNCEALTINPVPAPATNGELILKGNYQDTIFYGSIPILDSLVKGITIDPTEEGCGEIEYEVESNAYNSTTELTVAQSVLTSITVNAKVTCNGVPFTIGSAKAWVAPDFVVGDCSFTVSGPTYPWINIKNGLDLNDPVKNNYGRCDVKYSFDGTDFTVNTSLSLTDWGGEVLDNITTSVECGASVPQYKKCSEIDVAYYLLKEGNCDGDSNFSFSEGNTVFEFACADNKNDYYISCSGSRFSFTIEMEGVEMADLYTEYPFDGNDKIVVNTNANGYNVPDLRTEAMQVGNLYYYPEPILLKADEDITCRIW